MILNWDYIICKGCIQPVERQGRTVFTESKLKIFKKRFLTAAIRRLSCVSNSDGTLNNPGKTKKDKERKIMKKMIAILAAMMMVFCAVSASVAEESAPTFDKGVQFNMDMDQVMQLMNLPNPEIEEEHTRGTTSFWELEYEHATDHNGQPADIKFSFVGNSLVAIHYDMADGVRYEDVRANLVAEYGEAVPFDAAKIGNAKYVIDDDGELKDCKEMIEAKGVTIVLEQDREGDVDVTLLDPTAAYINN